MADGGYWLAERGIGEIRALRIEGGRAVELRLEREEELQPDSVLDARVVKILSGHPRRAIVELSGAGASDGQAILSPLPADITEGARMMVRVTRQGIQEQGRKKLPLVTAHSDDRAGAAKDLLERLRADGEDVRLCEPHQDGLLAQNGWYEIMEAAASRRYDFLGGSLDIGITSGMTVLDVDGDLEPFPLALAAAEAATQAIRLFGIGGSVGIDFPTLAERDRRAEVLRRFDDHMVPPCERTAINGFGFMQVVLRRTGPSLPERLAFDPVGSAALDLLRRAERVRQPGRLVLTAHPSVLAFIRARQGWITELQNRTGRETRMSDGNALAIRAVAAQAEPIS